MIFPKAFKSIFFYFIIWPFSSQNIIFTIFCFNESYYRKEARIYAATDTNLVKA